MADQCMDSQSGIQPHFNMEDVRKAPAIRQIINKNVNSVSWSEVSNLGQLLWSSEGELEGRFHYR